MTPQEMVLTFPVLWQGGRLVARQLSDLGCPRSIPWSMIALHAPQALRNHSQTLERLSERGGLGPQELVAVLTDKHWRDTIALTDAFAVALLLRIIKEAK